MPRAVCEKKMKILKQHLTSFCRRVGAQRFQLDRVMGIRVAMMSSDAVLALVSLDELLLKFLAFVVFVCLGNEGVIST